LFCTRRQLRSTGKDVATQIMDIIAARGKMHNPVTNSGGVLVGRVREVGSGVAEARGAGASDLRVGQLIVPVRCNHTRGVHVFACSTLHRALRFVLPRPHLPAVCAGVLDDSDSAADLGCAQHRRRAGVAALLSLLRQRLASEAVVVLTWWTRAVSLRSR
jgi:hypothetical protein